MPLQEPPCTRCSGIHCWISSDPNAKRPATKCDECARLGKKCFTSEARNPSPADEVGAGRSSTPTPPNANTQHRARSPSALPDASGPPESTADAPAEQDNASTTATTPRGSGEESCAAGQCTLDADKPCTFVRAYIGALPPRLAHRKPDPSAEGIELLETTADVSYKVRELRQENAEIRTMCDELRQDFATLREHLRARNSIRAFTHFEHQPGAAAASEMLVDHGAQTNVPASPDTSSLSRHAIPAPNLASHDVHEVPDDTVIASATLRHASALCTQDGSDMASMDDGSDLDMSSDDPDAV
ncbi:uncharacterized protein B0H18DRAFT_958921 [Fomitopsis serialis]|uniref:uncharacterized protein n=1 Tax=Fomitopsis serialis TaxID=139415 RepID=UPI002007C78F|nr:uncharacterized protein B0H18DRAFT_958921 [Neoantrodia serialis]KAH9916221.1 hypothetical protein B0H18DRAFT_958921 [Neoantrodia serialis]